MVEHQDLVGVLQAWPGVVTVLQLHGGVQQRQVPPHDEGVGAVCGDRRVEGGTRRSHTGTGSVTGCAGESAEALLVTLLMNAEEKTRCSTGPGKCPSWKRDMRMLTVASGELSAFISTTSSRREKNCCSLDGR